MPRYRSVHGKTPQASKVTISFLTDFGPPCDARHAMNSVARHIFTAHSRYGRAELILEDICTTVPHGNVLSGAWKLARAVTWATEHSGSVYVGVVDPQVGTSRRAVIVQTKTGKFLVGPDGLGLLSLAFEREGIERAFEIDVTAFSRLGYDVPPDCSTFHGRDVFTPAAAFLASGYSPRRLGREIDSGSLARISLVRESSEHSRAGSIVDVDWAFGNIRTCSPNSIPHELIGKTVPFRLLAESINLEARVRLVRTFSELRGREFGLVLSSTGSLDLVLNLDSAANRVGLTERHIALDEHLVPTARVGFDLSGARA